MPDFRQLQRFIAVAEERNFRRAGVTILGVSPDSVKSHAGFAGKYDLPFSLLSINALPSVFLSADRVESWQEYNAA